MLKPKQQAYIDAVIKNPKATEEELAQMAGVARKTVWTWKKQPEFKQALEDRIQEYWKESEMLAVAAMRSLTMKENFSAAKYILDSLGYAPAQKIDAKVSGDIEIVIDEDE